VFPDYDVKNRVKLEFPLDEELTDLINDYVHEFRPALVRGSNESWLFPGETGGFKTPTTLSDQITKRIENATGFRITVHQFRHAAAALMLKDHPGNYELVRRLLGHRNSQTTTNFYCGLETTQASEIFGMTVRKHMTFDPEEV
jgi:integrase